MRRLPAQQLSKTCESSTRSGYWHIEIPQKYQVSTCTAVCAAPSAWIQVQTFAKDCCCSDGPILAASTQVFDTLPHAGLRSSCPGRSLRLSQPAVSVVLVAEVQEALMKPCLKPTFQCMAASFNHPCIHHFWDMQSVSSCGSALRADSQLTAAQARRQRLSTRQQPCAQHGPAWQKPQQASSRTGAPAVNVTSLGHEARAKKAEEIGYRTIGADLPDGISLADIVKTMPKEVRFVLLH